MGHKSLVLLRFCPIVGQNMGQTLKTLASNRFWCGEIPNRNTVRVTELVCGSSGSKTGTKIFCVCAHKRYRFQHEKNRLKGGYTYYGNRDYPHVTSWCLFHLRSATRSS